MGRNAPASRALTSAVDAGFDVVYVVGPAEDEGREYSAPGVRAHAESLGIETGSLEDLAARLEGGLEYDLLISFLYWRKIPEPLLSAASVGAFNLHPGPLPGYRGARGYNFAIMEGANSYGASLHRMTPRFDDGDLVSTTEVPVRADDSALSLYRRTMFAALELIDEFFRDTISGAIISSVPQEGDDGWASRAEMIELSRIRSSDGAEEIARKARSFWFPPFPGATVKIDGRDFTLVESSVLKRVGELLHSILLDDPEDDRW